MSFVSFYFSQHAVQVQNVYCLEDLRASYPNGQPEGPEHRLNKVNCQEWGSKPICCIV